MGKIVLSVILLFVALSVSGQGFKTKCVSKIDTLTKTEIYENSDEYPSVKGGMDLLMKELTKISYPSDSSCYRSYQSKLWVAFIVGTDGRLTGKRTHNDPCMNKIGIQLLKLIDNVKWIPGKCNEKKVPVLYYFSLQAHLSQ